MAVPKLRFKDDNRQDYPEWEENKLGDIGCVMRGLTYKPTDVRDDGIRVFRSSNVSEDTFIYGEDDVFVDVNAVNIPFVQNGDILITAANGSSRLVGKHSIIHGVLNDTAVHGGFMLLIRSKDSAFINSSMYSSWYKKFVYKFVAGGNGAIGNLKKSDLENVHLFVPCEKEKNKINDFLTTVEKRITAQQNIIADLEETKKGLLQKIFSQEIRFKDDNGQDYPEWETHRLSDYAEYVSSTACCEAPCYLGTEDMISNFGGVNIKKSQGNYSGYRFGKNDIILGNIRPYLKKCWISDRQGICSTDLLVMNVKGIYPEILFMKMCTDEFVIYNMKGAKGTKMPRGDKKHIMNWTFRLPENGAEQQKIADFLSTFDKKITAEKQVLSDLQEMKKGLLQQMFV